MSTLPDLRRPLLVDGDLEPELARRGIPARPTPGAAPPPIREPEAVRRLLLEIGTAGADVLTAPTTRTHRRALSRLGEARRAREWTIAAVSLAREAAQMAADALDERAENAPAGGVGVARDGPPRVAGVLAPLEGPDAPEAAPDEATALAEHRTQAGLLADAGVDLIRIDGMETVRESHAATVAARELGLEVWSGAALDGSGTRLPSGEPLGAWLEAILPLEPTALVVEAPTDRAVDRALADLRGSGVSRLGVSLAVDLSPDALGATLGRWLDAGACLVGCGRDAGPARVAAFRAALDRWSEERLRTADAVRATWAGWLDQGARHAGAGEAVALLGEGAGSPPGAALPAGSRLAWRTVPAGDLAQLSAGRFGLGVAGADGLGRDDLGRLVSALAPGGWLLLAGTAIDPGMPEPTWVRWLIADGRIELLQPLDPAPETGLCAWLGRRRP